MTDQVAVIVAKVHEELTNGYWSSDDALKYTAQLFPFVEPEQRVRDALKALACKKDKDERFRRGQSAVESGRDFSHAFREIEHLLERYESRYRKRMEGEGRDFRDMAMMLFPAMMSQKGACSVSLDVNALTETIYKECETCPIRDVCKEAFPVCTEYVGASLKDLDLPISTDE